MKIRVSRYISREELEKFLSGEKLVNKKHHGEKNKSYSVGFCFLGEETVFRSQYDNKRHSYFPSECLKFLSGIVTPEILAEFEVNYKHLKKGYGIYADPTTDSFFAEKIIVSEYCTEEYSSRNFHLKWYKDLKTGERKVIGGLKL